MDTQSVTWIVISIFKEHVLNCRLLVCSRD